MIKLFFFALLFSLFSPAFSQQGLKGEYFNGRNFEITVGTRIDYKLNFSWNDEPPLKGMGISDFSVRWTGKLLAEETGVYTFSAIVDDGIRLWVGGKKVIDAWGPHDHESVSGKITMAKGELYDLKVEYFNGILEGQIQLMWEPPSAEKSVFDFLSKRNKAIEGRFLFQPEMEKPEPIAATAEPIVPKKAASKTVAPPINRIEEKPAAGIVKTSAKRMHDTIEKYTPKNILFEPGQPFLMDESFPELDRLVKLLKRFPSLKIKIEGHTDVTGDPQINMKLSEDRAGEVAFYLSENGIAPSRITTKGYGATRPITGGDAKKMYPQNRRVEFKIE